MTGLNAERILALLLRQLYLYRRSLIRQLEIVYWPVMDLLVWGFVSLYVGRLRGGGALAIAYLLGDPEYRASAGRVRDSFAAAGGAPAAAARLEQLAAS